MDIRELPRILLNEFGRNIVRTQERNESENRSEIFVAESSGKAILVAMHTYLPDHATLLKVFHSRSDFESGCSPYLQIYAGAQHLRFDEGKGNFYQDQVFVDWLEHRASVSGNKALQQKTTYLACRIVMKTIEHMNSGSFELPRYWLSSEYPDAERIPE